MENVTKIKIKLIDKYFIDEKISIFIWFNVQWFYKNENNSNHWL